MQYTQTDNDLVIDLYDHHHNWSCDMWQLV